MVKGVSPNQKNIWLWVMLALVGGVGGWASPAIADGIPGVVFGDESGGAPTEPAAGSPGPAGTTQPSAYTLAMLIGYEAVEQGDYQTALINFQRALAERPGDRYALRAIANVESYLAKQRQEAARRQRIDSLQVTLGRAVEARDWACSAATVDELITLVPQNSLERSRLITYRGELTIFLDSQSDIEQWSTVCPG